MSPDDEEEGEDLEEDESEEEEEDSEDMEAIRASQELALKFAESEDYLEVSRYVSDQECNLLRVISKSFSIAHLSDTDIVDARLVGKSK